jgi:phage shock protein A
MKGATNMASTRHHTPHASEKKNLSKVEFKLYSQSLPSELRKIPAEKIRKARAKTLSLVKKYRKSASAAKTVEDKKLARKVGIRLRSMEKTLDRYSKHLSKARKAKRKVMARPKKALTEQRKMRLNRKDDPALEFKMKAKRTRYERDTIDPRHSASAARQVSRRIAGFVKARGRKNQVARDVRSSSEE